MIRFSGWAFADEYLQILDSNVLQLFNPFLLEFLPSFLAFRLQSSFFRGACFFAFSFPLAL